MHYGAMTFRSYLFVGIVGLVSLGFCSGTATIQNPGFDTFIAATDSFPGWKIDTTGKSKIIVTQATDSAHSGTGCLKMQPKDATDTTTARISCAITGLSQKKAFTLTAWVKYADLPDYADAMIHVQQATMLPPAYAWINRKWLTVWTNPTIGTSDWNQITVSGATDDTANIFNLIITSKKGTLWVDDIAMTYQSVQVSKDDIVRGVKENIHNNRISFSHAMPYSLEACSLNGQTITRTTGIASSLDLNRWDITNGVYLMKVKTSEKTYTSRVVVSR